MKRYLDTKDFLAVVRDTPLVSIDLIVENEERQVLLGLRTNQPAQDYWFVPGGRIQKDESLDDAFLRLTEIELGVKVARKNATLLGVYEHFYDDNFNGTAQISTHYVVIAYRLNIKSNKVVAPFEQHQAYKWCDKSQILTDATVHENTQAYFAR